VIDAVRPDRIFHLAAQSFVPVSWHEPAQTLQTNVGCQVNLFEAIRAAGLDPIVHIAGSSEQYGLVHEDEVPIRESNPLRPLSPYAVSKVTQEMLAHQYFRSYGLRSVVTRAFNHTGPRRGHVLVTSSFARQIAEIEAGLKEPVLEVGDLSSRRDWTDVRDMVRGYWLALDGGCSPGETYNIGSGKAMAVQEMLNILLEASSADIEVRADSARFRPSDVKLLWGDASKFQAATGWAPEIPFTKTMADLLDYWRARTRQLVPFPSDGGG
jgi:GDP-4-dehydro-6-deoxy-D-mannose reductase